MAAYSLDLRERVLRAWDSGMDAESVAAKYEVSRAWVHRLVQRRRETGAVAPRRQTKFRPRVLAGQEERLAALIAARPVCHPRRVAGRLADDRRVEHALAGDRPLGLYL